MFEWLKRLNIFRSIENPAVPLSQAGDSEFEAFGAVRSPSGFRVSAKSALTYSAVTRAITLISRDVAKLPLFVFERTDVGKERAISHPAFPILRHKANSEMTAFVFRQTMTHHVLLHGNGYAWILRDGNANPLEMILLDPLVTHPIRANGRLWYVTKVNNTDVRESPENIFHFKGLGFDGLVGFSVLSQARESLGLGLAMQRFGSKFFANNARPSVVLEHPDTLGEVAGKNLKTSWNKMHQGLENSHKTAVLEEGMKAKILQISARDSQLIQSREFEIRQIANWFGVPGHKLGDPTRTSFSSLEQENQSYLDEALDGWLVNFEEEAREKLLTENQKRLDSHFIEFERKALIKTDMMTRFSAYSTALGGAPFMAVNEVRTIENLPRLEGHDDILLPLNMATFPDDGTESDSERSTEEIGEKTLAITTESADAEDNDDRFDAHRRLICLTVGKVIRSLEIYAARSSRKPAGFLAWLDEFELRNDSHVRACLQPLVDACSTLHDGDSEGLLNRSVEGILSDLREEMLRVSGECTAKELEAGVTVLFEESIVRVGDKIAELILGDCDGTETQQPQG